MKKLLLKRNKAMPEDVPSAENNPVPYFRQASLESYRSFLEDDSLDSSSPFCIPRRSKLLEMFPSPCSMIDSDSDSRGFSSSVASVTPVKPVVLRVSTTPPAEAVEVLPTPQKIKKVRRRKRNLLLSDGVTSLDHLASTSTPLEWAAHFKKADFGTDYILRPRTERPRYDLQSDEAVEAAVIAATFPSRRKSKDDPSSPSKPAAKRRAEQSRGPKRGAPLTTAEVQFASSGFPDKFRKLIAAASFANGIHCVCSSSLDIGPQIECEKCGLWQHMFCMNMFGKDTEGYLCNHCNGNLQNNPYNPEEALRAFSAYASSLPVTSKKNAEDEKEENGEGEERKGRVEGVQDDKTEKMVVVVRKAPKRLSASSENPRRKPGRPPKTYPSTKTEPSILLLRPVSAETSMTSEPETPAVSKKKPVYGRSEEAAPETPSTKFNEPLDFNLRKKISLKIVRKRTNSPKALLTVNPVPEFNSIAIAGDVSRPPKNLN